MAAEETDDDSRTFDRSQTEALSSMRGLGGERETSPSPDRAGEESPTRGGEGGGWSLRSGPTGDDGDFYFEDDVISERPGDAIDRYRLVRPLGEGGFGIVWLADQVEPVRRSVALKVIKLGMDTRQVVARFEQERQALAVMDHPHIARVIDAGATSTGRPYFVMDLVKGEPITSFCDRHRLTIDARLQLFDQVCSAVQHAHVKGIIHRDLKPSNILVGETDGRPHATVIDFGIAKATSTRLTDSSFATSQGQVIGTVLYMSPEQVAGSLDLDTRADVYALGVVLYELLVGRSPFDLDTIRRAMLTEVQRIIREVDPMRPSAALVDSGEDLQDLAKVRGTEPARLKAQVKGELDWIVIKALEKDRARRYETVEGLRMDIERYLRGAAVTAVPPSRSYRLRKFTRRNRAAVLAVGSVIVALAIGLVGFAWQAGVARDQRDRAIEATKSETRERERAHGLALAEAEQRGAAEENAARADAINKFLLEILASANVRQLGREAKVIDALDRAAATVGEAFAGNPVDEGGVRSTLGRAYLTIGQLDKAEEQLLRAVEIWKDRSGSWSFDHARALHDLGNCQGERGDDAAAVATHAAAVRMVESFAEKGGVEPAGFRSDYANALVRVGRFEEAETIFRELLEAERARPVPSHQLPIVLNSLAVLVHKTNRLEEAEKLYREALAAGERILGPEHPDTITPRMNLASVLRSSGRLAEAEPLMKGAHESICRVFGPEHWKAGVAAQALAGLYHDMGRSGEGLPYARAALAIFEKSEGDQGKNIADIKSTLSQMLSRLGDFDGGLQMERDVVEYHLRHGGPESQEALAARLDLANCLVRSRLFDEAKVEFESLIEACPRVLGEDSKTTIIVTNSYAVMLLGLQEYAQAEPWLRKALETGRRVEGAKAVNTVITQCNLGCCLRELGRLDEAETEFDAVVEGFEEALGPSHPNVAAARSALGETYERQGHLDDAEEEYRAAVAIMVKAQGDQNPATLGRRSYLAMLLVKKKEFAEAERMLEESVAGYVKAYGPRDWRSFQARARLGHCRAQQGRFADAEALLVEAHQSLAAAGEPGRQGAEKAALYLSELYEAWNAASPSEERVMKAREWRSRTGGVRRP